MAHCALHGELDRKPLVNTASQRMDVIIGISHPGENMACVSAVQLEGLA